MRITNGPRYRLTELGPEARCSKCREWWPADSEFFYQQADGCPHSWCIACYTAWRNGRRLAAQPSRVTSSPAATGTPPHDSRPPQ